MGWHAKPSGNYGYDSIEGKENIAEMNMFFNNRGYTLEAQAGIFGNAVGESGLNPWRWQSDTVSLSAGYGLFQYTPASDYINGASHLEYYSPNLSVTGVTAGASPEDGYAQCTAFADNTLGKWTTSCWRPYWDSDTYADLYAVRTDILNIYGDGSRLTLPQFKGIDNVYYATFAFLACFEGPAVPNMGVRYEYASDIYSMLSGDTPITPNPPQTKRKKMPIWLLLRYGL